MGFQITPGLTRLVHKYGDDLTKIIHALTMIDSDSDIDALEMTTSVFGGVRVGGASRGGGADVTRNCMFAVLESVGGVEGGDGGDSIEKVRLRAIEEEAKAARVLAAEKAEEMAVTAKCILCMTGVKEYMCYPCKHVLFCRHCFAGDGMWSKMVDGKIPCPICRRMATVEKIYL